MEGGTIKSSLGNNRKLIRNGYVKHRATEMSMGAREAGGFPCLHIRSKLTLREIGRLMYHGEE